MGVDGQPDESDTHARTTVAAALLPRYDAPAGALLVVVDRNDPAQIPLGLVSTSDIVAEMAAPELVWQT
jgi:hypothetical protein